MAPEGTTLDFVVSQTWECLSVPVVGRNVLFDKVFFDKEMLSEIATAANLTFAPGLLDVVQSPFPPPIAFFKNLPVKYLGLWAIYSLVLKQEDCIPIVYTGEGSDSKRGLPARWAVYNKPETYRRNLPTKVREALDAGYKITHKGVLAYSPIPSVKDIPRFRVLSYALEAMFSFLFWTMHPKVKDYQIASCCPWPRESFTYGGLCSHNALIDPIRANVDLSAKELELLDAQNKQSKRLRSKGYRDHRKAVNPDGVRQERKHQRERRKAEDPDGVRKYHSDYYQHEKAEAPEKLKARARKADKRYRTHSHGKSVAKGRRFTAKRKAAKTYFCKACDQPCDKASSLARHNRSTKHMNRVAKLAAGVIFQFRCNVCDKGFEDEKALRVHGNGDRHKARAAAATAAAGATAAAAATAAAS